MIDLHKLYEAIGSLANELAKTGKKMTFSEVNKELGNPRKSSRAIAGDIRRAYNYFLNKGDYETANHIATSFTNKNGDWAWLGKEGYTKK